MFSLKETLILIFVLLGSLVIFFSNWGSDSQREVSPPKAVTEIKSPAKKEEIKIKISDLFKKESQLDKSLAEESFLFPAKTKEIEPKKISQESFSQGQASQKLLSDTPLFSLEDILAEAKNLSSDLNLEFEEYQSGNCSICQTEQQGENDLEEHLSSRGYSSWEEYSSSEEYRLAEEHFLINKNNLLRNPSIYPAIYAQVGGGCGCWDPACYVVTPTGIYWHCLGPCCCACCIICCR